MTVQSTTYRADYTGNGATTAFTVPFYFLDNTHVRILRTQISTGTVTTLALSTDYALTGAGVSAGGTATAVVAPTSDQKISILRNVPLTQLVHYVPNDPFPAATHEQALDQLTMEVQQLNEAISRSIKISSNNTISSPEMNYSASARAGLLIGFDSNGDITVSQALGNYKGNWSSGTTYAQRDIIKDTSNANIYLCLTAHTSSGSQPISTNTDSAKWALLVDAATATTAATNAAASATAAATSASAASTSATNAASSASSASTNASTATTQAGNASSSASSASTSATTAASSATGAAASATAAAAAAASGLYRQVLDKSANYTIVAADQGTLFRSNTGSGAITFTLPLISTVTDGFKVSIVKWTNDANTTNTTRSGGDTINGGTATAIGSQYSQVVFVADFETNTWFASQSGLGATNRNVDRFSGNNSTTAFTLSADPGALANTDVFISGAHQDHLAYTVSGTTLTFSAAPATGTSNIEVVYSTPLPIGTPSDGTVTTAKIVDANVTTAKIADANVTAAKLANSGVTAGSYTTSNITVNAAGLVTAASTGSAGIPGVFGQVFTSSGTFTVPAGVTAVKVTVCGGGGGGGLATGGPCVITLAGVGGPGGVGAVFATGLTPGGTVSVTIGGAGAGGAAGNNSGGAGGTTSFGAIASATGGGGAPGAPPGSTVQTGGAIGRSSGSLPELQSNVFGPNGYPSPNSNGLPPAWGFGGGGGGGYDLVGVNRSGAAGKPGVCVVEW